MDKLAVFVAGQTEQLFVVRLIRAIAGSHNVNIDTVQAFGGKLSPRHFIPVIFPARRLSGTIRLVAFPLPSTVGFAAKESRGKRVLFAEA